MKANKVPSEYIRWSAMGKLVHVPKPMRRPTLWWPCVATLQGSPSWPITTVLTSPFVLRAFDIKTMGAGRCHQTQNGKRKSRNGRTMKPLMEMMRATSWNCQWDVGTWFPSLENSISIAAGRQAFFRFISMETTSSRLHLLLWMVWEKEALLSSWCEHVKEESLSKTRDYANVADSHQPWLKDGWKWVFLEICQG